MMKRSAMLGAFVVVLLAGPAARAQLPNQELMCRADDPRADKYGYLRSLMLDLTGSVPTPADYARLDAEADVPEAWIDQMLASDAFVQRAVRLHRALVWNNVDNVNLINFRASLTIKRPENLYWRRTPAVLYRGLDVPCRDVPATYDANGDIEFVVQNGVRLEGYVLVRPYWAPETEIKVCAWDAQTTRVAASGADCTTSEGFSDRQCGCGEGLQLCRYGSMLPVTQAFAGDIERRVAAVIREGRPYTEIFSSRRAWVNGPLVHFLKHQTGVPAGVRVDPMPVDRELLPDLEWARDADNWQEIEQPEGHAGVLTSIGYLLRFQTNRARASRFFDAFLCQPFSPPTGGLPVTDPDALPNPDLQQRDGCKYCHALLEPAASHWGRWTERGAGHLTSAAFPAERADCRTCGMTGQLCSRDCRLYYITRTFTSAEEPYIGSLNAYQFLRDEHRRNVEAGPRLLMANAVVDDRFPSCTARRAMEGMFGRDLSAEEGEWLGELGRRFVASGYDYKALIKAVVTSPIYRRVR